MMLLIIIDAIFESVVPLKGIYNWGIEGRIWYLISDFANLSTSL